MATSAINPSDINRDISRFEVTEVYAHPQAQVDIVLVHGLNGHPEGTWKAKNNCFWPTDLLPLSLQSEDPNKFAKVRILVYGYNADVYAFGDKSASSDKIHEHAQSLLSSLVLERKSEEAESHPIIWVAHSLGGILVKRALELSNDLQSKSADDFRQIYISTFGIIFLGTPHTGADPAKWGLIIQSMVDALVPKKLVDTEAVLVKTLKTNNQTLQNINLHFLDIYQNFKICMAHETVKTDLKGTKFFIVDQISASPSLPDVIYFGIEATHSGMCKFETKRSPGYRNVSTTIKSWALESPRVIQLRRENERRRRRQQRQEQIEELRNIDGDESTENHPSTSANTADLSNSAMLNTTMIRSVASIEPDENDYDGEQLFIKPPGFRPNSLFVGRQEELNELHKMLFDPRRRSEGTSAVLIQSMPGGGKSHLARQYVYEHRQYYPGGIFWLRAKSLSELAMGFWEIARIAAIKSAMVDEDFKILDENDQFIKIVTRWLNHRHDWLMVLDGIHFDDHFRKFIPDSTNTSLIYTSTEKSVSGDHHFVNPQLLKLPALSAREAQQLLLLELGKREPFSKDDLLHSMELVQAMGFLPVVIHTVAQRLKATDEPLARYARSYASGPRLRDLNAFTSVADQLRQLEAFEALNLMMIICFYSQHIPVEMISLGLTELDVPVKANDATGRSLNNTFKTLNTFALIDRNEHEAPSIHSSQSSKSSRDLLAENIDVIRLHSVVQDFFVDKHLEKGTFPMWLDRAIKVFCRSFDAASERIFRKTNSGRVEDYRLYEIHGIRLREHLENHRKEYSKRRRDEIWDWEATHLRLQNHITVIRAEIERRTPESSHVIARGRSDTFQTSIFDRTSSSSDTSGETPAQEKHLSQVFTWGLGDNRGQLESPSSIHEHDDYRQPEVQVERFALLPHEDTGYDSDKEGSVAMTRQPSDRTVRQPPSPSSPGTSWETVKSRQRSDRLDIHRTIKSMESKRYHDSAGAFRAISATDPRVGIIKEHAIGFVSKDSSRPHSRGAISGQSSAEVALTHITKSSPPPPRGPGMIRDRRTSSQTTAERPNLITRSPTYATAVSGPTKDNVPQYREASRPQTQSSSSDGISDHQSPLSAMESLQRFPHKKPPPSPTDVQFTPMPPYPNETSAATIPRLPRRYSQGNLQLGPDPFPSKSYPRMTTPLPYETSRPSSSPHNPPNLPRDYPIFGSMGFYPESLPASFYVPNQQPPPNLSLSSPNILYSSDETYYPGYPELSYLSPNTGYTSQPMSRDHSGESSHSTQSVPPTSSRRRRPSLTETEPIPQLPFSPQIPPTSYQIYKRMRELQLRERQQNDNNGKIKKSRFLRAAEIERLDEWEGQQGERNYTPTPYPTSRKPTNLNPAAPAFSPHPPPVPPNSVLSNKSPAFSPHSPAFSFPSPVVSERLRKAQSPLFRQSLNQASFENWNGERATVDSGRGGDKDGAVEGAPEMIREGSSGSGGLRLSDGTVFEFGGLGSENLGLGLGLGFK